MDNVCPHCASTPCLTFWRKLVLGPGGWARCQVCGNYVGIERARASIVSIPPVLFIASLGFGWLPERVAAAVLALMLPLCALLYVHWVPLTRWVTPD